MDHIWWASGRLKISVGLKMRSQLSHTLFHLSVATLYVQKEKQHPSWWKIQIQYRLNEVPFRVLQIDSKYLQISKISIIKHWSPLWPSVLPISAFNPSSLAINKTLHTLHDADVHNILTNYSHMGISSLCFNVLKVPVCCNF